MKNNSTIAWLVDWFQSRCDGEWEHANGVKIETLDNPGWTVTIDLRGTKWKDLIVAPQTVENGDDDWYTFKIEDSIFQASGDPSKLETILSEFRQIVEPQ